MRRDLDECRSILNQILAKDPRNIEAMLQRGRLLGVLCNFDEARDWMSRAVAAAPPKLKPVIALKAGFLSRDLYDPLIAEHFYREARTTEHFKTASLALAEHLGRIRRRPEACSLVDEVLEDEPRNPEALFLKARFGGFRSDDVEAALVGLVDGPNPELRVRAGYELGNYLDRRGDFENAMAAFASAKNELKAHAKPLIEHRRHVRKRFTDFSSRLSKETTRSWLNDMFDPSEGYSGIALIAGHPRSGTTLLEQIIDAHSATVAAEETENFSLFAFVPLLQKALAGSALFDALNGLSGDRIAKARHQYLESISRVVGSGGLGSLLVDKNPSLSHLVAVFLRVFPEARIISMVRDPRDVVLSCYMQPFVPLNPVTACYTDLGECALEYAQVMKTHVESTEVFSESVLEIQYEDLVEDVESKSEEVLGFLGLQWEEDVLNFHERAQEKVIRSPTSEAVTEAVHQRAVKRWQNYSKFLEPVFPALEPFLRRWGY